MFVVGSIIFVVYIYFYFRIVIRQHKDERQDLSAYETEDLKVKKD